MTDTATAAKRQHTDSTADAAREAAIVDEMGMRYPEFVALDDLTENDRKFVDAAEKFGFVMYQINGAGDMNPKCKAFVIAASMPVPNFFKSTPYVYYLEAEKKRLARMPSAIAMMTTYKAFGNALQNVDLDELAANLDNALPDSLRKQLESEGKTPRQFLDALATGDMDILVRAMHGMNFNF